MLHDLSILLSSTFHETVYEPIKNPMPEFWSNLMYSSGFTIFEIESMIEFNRFCFSNVLFTGASNMTEFSSSKCPVKKKNQNKETKLK